MSGMSVIHNNAHKNKRTPVIETARGINKTIKKAQRYFMLVAPN
jgi:hypothetical protein